MAKTKITVKELDTRNLDDHPSWESEMPSKIIDRYWVFASVKEQKSHKRKFKSNKTGKWLVFVDIKELDKAWKTIKQATEKGILGIGAKAATAKPNRHASSEKEKVICVYTYNWQDVDDVYRVEKSIRSIGIETTLYYKTDQDTLAGNYRVNGSNTISKYISKATKNFNKFDLAALNGIGYEKVEILKKIGIKNFDDLLAFDTSQKLEKVGVSSGYINKLKLYALSQIENKIFKLRPVPIPNNEVVHFDIETDLSLSYHSKKVWSVAIHHNNKVKRFYADTLKHENKILKEFLNYLKDIENPNLFCYSGAGFDKNVLISALKRHDLDADYFINCNHFDLCTLLKQNFILPIKSYGLKEVGNFLGYKFKQNDFNGLYVAMTYIQCQRTGEKLPKDIFHYIDDDVKAMDYIIKQIQYRQDIKDVFDHDIKD